MDPENFPHSLVTGGQVSRVDPESTGLNPAWRNSLVYMIIYTGWQDGATLTEIQAARQLFIREMKVLEGIAPESGAYLNEVRELHAPTPAYFNRASFFPPRLRDMNSTGRNRSLALTTTSSGPSSRSTIRNRSFSFTMASDRMSGMQISSAECETPFFEYPPY